MRFSFASIFVFLLFSFAIQSIFSQQAEVAEVLRLVNVERARVGLPPLRSNPILQSVAQEYAETMRRGNFFSHTGQDGSSSSQRMTRAGYVWSTAGENIARGQTTPASVMNSWMNSSGHRANILSAQFTEIGIGLSSSGFYWVQDFGTPRGGSRPGQPAPQPRPQPVPQPRPQPVPQPFPQPRPGSFPETRPGSFPQPRPQPVPQPFPQPRPGSFPETRPQPVPFTEPRPTGRVISTTTREGLPPGSSLFQDENGQWFLRKADGKVYPAKVSWRTVQ